MYSNMAKIAEARGRPAAAAQWRRKEQESYAAYAGAVHKLPQWAPQFINAVVAAAQGNADARTEVERILPQLEEGGWHNLCGAVRRILAGEHDLEKLSVGLDREDAYIVRAILSGGTHLGGASHLETEPPPPEEPQGMSLGDLLGLVATATQPGAPPALGGVLHRILSGDRDPDLSKLSPDLAAAVRELLE